MILFYNSFVKPIVITQPHRILLLLLLVCTGCIPLSGIPVASVTPFPLQTRTVEIPSPTLPPTVVWFPPTATFTPYPTTSPPPPTPDQHPGLGRVLLQDDFTDSSPWTLHNDVYGRVTQGKQELTIAIQEAKAYLYSLRVQPVLSDFYAEITASPSLCQEKDEYGLLVRAASEADYYRFSLSCSGQARLDRILKGQASSPQPWIETGTVPSGSPSVSRLAVWAVGDEMRFFANDRLLFTVRDPTIPTGSIGIFARSSGGHALTVNFSDLTIYQVNP